MDQAGGYDYNDYAGDSDEEDQLPAGPVMALSQKYGLPWKMTARNLKNSTVKES